jgi:hypothetical protein
VSCSKEGSEFESPLRSPREGDEQGAVRPRHLTERFGLLGILNMFAKVQ